MVKRIKDPTEQKRIAELKAIRSNLDKVFEEYAKQHGLRDLHLGKAKYTAGGSFTFELKGIFADGLSEEAQRYNSLLGLFNLPELGSDWKARDGKVFKTVGINTTGSKVFVEDANGARYEVKTEAVSLKNEGE